ncbi:MAG: SpoIIE family protein phosphatase [Lysobacteraceae bacterium]
MNAVAADDAVRLERRMLPQLAELSQQLALSLDLEQTLRQAVDRIADFMQAEAAAVFLMEGDNLVCRACAGPVDVRGLSIPKTRGIVGRTVERNTPQLVRDAHTDPDFLNAIDDNTGFVTRSILCAPLSTAEGPIGALQVLNKRDGGLFDTADRDALRLLAAPTALAVSGAHMAEELLEQNRIRRELGMARKLQRSLLPKRRRGGYPVRALNLPAREISGDFYDFFDLPDGRIAFASGDVSGKGLDAAFLMVRCASLLRWSGKEGLPPSEWMARINDELGEAIASGMFVCAVAGYYEPKTQTAVWASAGFPPLLRVDRDGAVQRFDAQAPPLGIMDGLEFPEQQTDLRDASLYLYSDGVTDVRDGEGGTLDVEGVEALLSELAGLKPEPRLRAIVRRLRSYRLTDDTTLLLIEGGHGDSPELLDIAFPARPEELANVRRRCHDAFQRLGMDGELAATLVLAIDEAAANVIRHAYGGACAGRVELRLLHREAESGQRRLSIELRDFAPCVDPSVVKAKTLGECRPGGLGVAMIDEIMDGWDLQPAPDGKGNRLRMWKTLPALSGD